MTGIEARSVPTWLALREIADARARATDLLAPLRAYLPADGIRIRDLGAGTGSLPRWLAPWLAPQLPGPQHWTLHDREADRPAVDALSAADGAPVTVDVQAGDVAALSAADLAGTDLVTGSALLDLLTAHEVDAITASCAAAGCAVLWTTTVTGRAVLDPPDALDSDVAAAFDAHQRRTVDGRSLLGPDAVDAATDALGQHGYVIRAAAGPWRLGPADAALTAEWLRGWVDAAAVQRPDLPAAAYLERRLAASAAGALRVVVGHRDVLGLPR